MDDSKLDFWRGFKPIKTLAGNTFYILDPDYKEGKTIHKIKSESHSKKHLHNKK